jgi:hypothetical protein
VKRPAHASRSVRGGAAAGSVSSVATRSDQAPTSPTGTNAAAEPPASRRGGSTASQAIALANPIASLGPWPRPSWSGVNRSCAPRPAATTAGLPQPVASTMVSPNGRFAVRQGDHPSGEVHEIFPQVLRFRS